LKAICLGHIFKCGIDLHLAKGFATDMMQKLNANLKRRRDIGNNCITLSFRCNFTFLGVAIMKKLALLTLSVLLLIGSVVPVFSQIEELVMWSRYDLADTEDANAVTLNERITAFQDATGITVRYETIAWDQLSTKLAIAVQAGGDVPDIIEVGSQHVPSLLDAGALMPLDDLLQDEAFLAELGEGDTLACVVEGVRYCVAHNVRGGMAYYKVADFPEGYPQTAEEWLATAPVFKEQELFFSTQFAGRNYGAIEIAWWPMIHSNGGSVFDAEGKPAWATPEVVEVVGFSRQLYSNGYLPEANITGDFSDAEAPWIDGSAVSFRGGSWSAIFVPGLQDAVEAGEVAMTGGVAFGEGNPYVFMVSEGWAVATGAKNPDGARAWLTGFMEPEFLAKWAAAQYGIPTTQSAYEASEFAGDFYQNVDTILGEQGLYMQQSPYYVESLDALAIAWQELLLDPNLDAMTRLQAAADEVLNRYWS
jgi:ABC-type glycerol-3-phosphate transport system substrate-binding protein